MVIALDAMGGDHAPGEIVRGALAAARELGIASVLFGDREVITRELGEESHPLLTIEHAPEVIAMDEPPVTAVRRKRQSSLVRAIELVREGRAVAAVSAGSTGAAMAAALLYLGRISGIHRPAIATVLPNEKGRTLLLDVGANVDCRPEYLVQFALMGDIYARKILQIAEPRIGLLSIGEEETKGNETTLATLPLLRRTGLNFIGNVEGRDIFRGTVDVVVCDGFVGNIVLKASETLALLILKMVKEEITKNWLARLGTVLAAQAFKELKQRLDYTEYGGAPLLGVNGVVIIAHGSSNAAAIKNALRVAQEAHRLRVVEAIAEVSRQPVAAEVPAVPATPAPAGAGSGGKTAGGGT